ncbi:hypothetical protein C8R44DRAFT_992211 [Mycena epipterygia]|nr:hypothetical protein C8R44DRAFT_992211 [Mycena epipterygia]
MASGIYLKSSTNHILNTKFVAPDGTVEYTTSTPTGLFGRRSGPTAVLLKSGARAMIDWGKKTFTIDGTERKWSAVRKNILAGTLGYQQWTWTDIKYRVKRSEEYGEYTVGTLFLWDTIQFDNTQNTESDEVRQLVVFVSGRLVFAQTEGGSDTWNVTSGGVNRFHIFSTRFGQEIDDSHAVWLPLRVSNRTSSVWAIESAEANEWIVKSPNCGVEIC